MSVNTRTFEAALYGGGGTNLPVALRVTDASVTLDEGWSPYAQASIVIKNPGLTTLARISNLAARPRITLRIESASAGFFGGTPTVRTFDLGIIARQVFVKDGTVGISLASDEAVLQDYAHTGLTADVGMRPLQSSVRNLVQYVMNRALTTNEIVEFNDFDFTTSYALTNLWPFIPKATNEKYIAASGAFAQANDTYGFGILPTSTSTTDTYAALDVALTPGKKYTFRGEMYQSSPQTGELSNRARRLAVAIYQPGGIFRLLAFSPQVANVAGRTTTSFTFTVPTNVLGSELRLYNGAKAQGGTVFWNNLLVVEGDGLNTEGFAEQYFDGSTPANSLYTYEYDGDVGTSSSTRTPRLNRSPEILMWKPGQTAWEFLAPILEAAGLRFWCDEQRRWHLTTSAYSVPGTVQAWAGSNLYEATDLMSRTATQSDGVPLFVDAVILRYTWVDDLGNDRERYDVATTSGSTKPLLIERPETPFPGAGAATYLLRRYMMRRRQVPVTAALSLTATPGMAVSIRTGDGATLTGYLDAVTFDMGADEMPLKTKNLI